MDELKEEYALVYANLTRDHFHSLSFAKAMQKTRGGRIERRLVSPWVEIDNDYTE